MGVDMTSTSRPVTVKKRVKSFLMYIYFSLVLRSSSPTYPIQLHSIDNIRLSAKPCSAAFAPTGASARFRPTGTLNSLFHASTNAG
jgi:hypothetical protein